MAVRRRRMRRRLRENRNIVSKKVIRDRMNPLENYSEEDIFNRFRFRLPTIMYIMNTIEHSINHNSKKNCALPPVLQLLTCLRFLATGAFHRLVGDSIGISETTTGKCCRSVCDAIISNLLQIPSLFPRKTELGKQKNSWIVAFRCKPLENRGGGGYPLLHQ